MTKIVGIDFGTSNVRISQWDADSGENPSSCQIGSQSPFAMPTVIAFQRQPDGEVVTIYGDDADALDDRAPDVEVARNIKRWVLTSDAYVRQQVLLHLAQRGESQPKWWDFKTRTIRVWDDAVVVNGEDAIKQILKQAISKSGLAGTVAEWRAGCPVDSDLAYRRALVSALDELGCEGRVEWITEEPLLLLALGRETGILSDGYYLIYDLGGGSFDCAIVEVRGEQLAVLSNEGLPLGGTDIDDKLIEGLGYDGPVQILRIAKEQLYSDDGVTEIDLGGGQTVSRQDIDLALDGFIGNFVNETLRAVLNAYKRAQLLIDESTSQEGWQASIDSVEGVIDRVLVVGGPTRMPYFTDRLTDIFGTENVVTADELTRSADRADILDPTLTMLSHGACYMQGKSYIPLTVDRIPAKITLRVTDGHTVEEDSYEPFVRLSASRLLAPYEGRLIIRRDPYNQVDTVLDPTVDSTYSVVITSPDGDTLYESDPQEMRMPRNGYTGPRADRIKLVVDRLGGVTVVLGAGFVHVPSPLEDTIDVIPDPQWQIDLRTEGGSGTLAGERLEQGRRRLPELGSGTQAPGALESYETSREAAYGDGGRRN